MCTIHTCSLDQMAEKISNTPESAEAFHFIHKIGEDSVGTSRQ